MSYKHENYAFVNKYGIRTHEQHSVRSMEMNVCHVNRISSQNEIYYAYISLSAETRMRWRNDLHMNN